MPGGEVEQGLRQADPLVMSADRDAGLQPGLVGAGNGHPGNCAAELEAHPEIGHPTHGLVGALDQHPAQQRVGAPAGDALEIAFEGLGGVGIDDNVRGVVGVLDDRQQVVEPTIGEAKDAAGKAGVAAAERLRRLFEHHHFASRTAGGERRGECRVAGPDHDHVGGIFLAVHHRALLLKAIMGLYWIRISAT